MPEALDSQASTIVDDLRSMQQFPSLFLPLEGSSSPALMGSTWQTDPLRACEVPDNILHPDLPTVFSCGSNLLPSASLDDELQDLAFTWEDNLPDRRHSTVCSLSNEAQRAEVEFPAVELMSANGQNLSFLDALDLQEYMKLRQCPGNPPSLLEIPPEPFARAHNAGATDQAFPHTGTSHVAPVDLPHLHRGAGDSSFHGVQRTSVCMDALAFTREEAPSQANWQPGSSYIEMLEARAGIHSRANPSEGDPASALLSTILGSSRNDSKGSQSQLATPPSAGARSSPHQAFFPPFISTSLPVLRSQNPSHLSPLQGVAGSTCLRTGNVASQTICPPLSGSASTPMPSGIGHQSQSTNLRGAQQPNSRAEKSLQSLLPSQKDTTSNGSLPLNQKPRFKRSVSMRKVPCNGAAMPSPPLVGSAQRSTSLPLSPQSNPVIAGLTSVTARPDIVSGRIEEWDHPSSFPVPDSRRVLELSSETRRPLPSSQTGVPTRSQVSPSNSIAPSLKQNRRRRPAAGRTSSGNKSLNNEQPLAVEETIRVHVPTQQSPCREAAMPYDMVSQHEQEARSIPLVPTSVPLHPSQTTVATLNGNVLGHGKEQWQSSRGYLPDCSRFAATFGVQNVLGGSITNFPSNPFPPLMNPHTVQSQQSTSMKPPAEDRLDLVTKGGYKSENFMVPGTQMAVGKNRWSTPEAARVSALHGIRGQDLQRDIIVPVTDWLDEYFTGQPEPSPCFPSHNSYSPTITNIPANGAYHSLYAIPPHLQSRISPLGNKSGAPTPQRERGVTGTAKQVHVSGTGGEVFSTNSIVPEVAREILMRSLPMQQHLQSGASLSSGGEEELTRTDSFPPNSVHTSNKVHASALNAASQIASPAQLYNSYHPSGLANNFPPQSDLPTALQLEEARMSIMTGRSLYPPLQDEHYWALNKQVPRGADLKTAVSFSREKMTSGREAFSYGEAAKNMQGTSSLASSRSLKGPASTPFEGPVSIPPEMNHTSGFVQAPMQPPFDPSPTSSCHNLMAVLPNISIRYPSVPQSPPGFISDLPSVHSARSAVLEALPSQQYGALKRRGGQLYSHTSGRNELSNQKVSRTGEFTPRSLSMRGRPTVDPARRVCEEEMQRSTSLPFDETRRFRTSARHASIITGLFAGGLHNPEDAGQRAKTMPLPQAGSQPEPKPKRFPLEIQLGLLEEEWKEQKTISCVTQKDCRDSLLAEVAPVLPQEGATMSVEAYIALERDELRRARLLNDMGQEC
eukprot:TRINITY_DN35727_c0_g1_i1.p1 TRINITY_DN35727_c0_g1~~TRINITY_DN35727_c0_g1_i1.p1  ORF type:complete len:1245 (+),score=126.35 TRINITY_DN35727_c0_g1_i1:860-4594(+)